MPTTTAARISAPLSRRTLLGAGGLLSVGVAGGLSADTGTRFTLDTVAAQAADRAASVSRDQKLALLLPVGSEDNLRPVVAAFQQRTGIQVSQQFAPVDDIATFLLLTRSTSRDAFDVALPPTFGIADLAEAGAIEPLDEWTDRYEPVEYRSDMLYRSGEQVDGRFYGYQTDGDVYLSFINEALLQRSEQHKAYADRYGREPGEVATWAELDQLMAFYHRPEQGQFGGTLFRTPAYAMWEFWLRLHAAGLAPFDAEMRPQLTQEPAVAALAALVAASASQEPGARTNDLFQNWQSFKAGDKLVNIGWGGSQKAFFDRSSSVRQGIRAFLPPGDSVAPAGLPYFNWGWNYTVPSGSARSEVGYLFSLFACSPSMSTQAVRQPDGYFDPFRASHYDDPEIRATYSQPFLTTHAEAMRRCLPDCYIGGQSDYFAALARYISLAIERRLSPEEALRATERQWQQITGRRGRDRQIQSWQSVRNSYPEAVRTTIVGLKG